MHSATKKLAGSFVYLFGLFTLISCGGNGGDGGGAALPEGGEAVPSIPSIASVVTPAAEGNWQRIHLAPSADNFGPPPPDDPSHFTAGIGNSLLPTLPHASEGAFEGGPTGTLQDARINNVRPPGALENGIDVPTNSRPSPLFGAKSFTQQMLRTEELGTASLDPTLPAPAIPFPRPTAGAAPAQDPASFARSGPAPAALDAFLDQDGLSPFPSEFSNTLDENPWKADIEAFLGRELETPPAEGRPPGEGWSHQRWNEFFPQVFAKAAVAGSRVNGGIRDRVQRHGYAVGEFAPGGLYHTVFESSVPGAPRIEGTTKGLEIRFHPLFPVQNHKSLWTFDGTLPPKMLAVRHGQAILFRNYNALPIDPSANRGFGLHTITTHEHNGHTPGESDGFTNAFFFPGQFYDYRWPLQLAGYDTTNTAASDPRAAFPCAPGETLFVNDGRPNPKTCENGSIRIRGDFRETMSSHWFHDHMIDFTAQNVYKGNAAKMNIYSVLDRGNEAIDDGVNLRLPSGTALPWGNRDYDVNLFIMDKAWDQDGQLWFNIFNPDGFIGDQITTNLLWHPYFNVRERRYRFRILDASTSRFFALALVRQVAGDTGELPGPPGSGVSYERVPLHLIANDGNIMKYAIPFDGSRDLDYDGDFNEHKGELPVMGVAERYDIIVDFSRHGIAPGDRLYFVNTLEHTDGRAPKRKIPLAEVLAETYKARLEFDENGGPERWVGGDPGVGRFLELRVVPYSGKDLSMDPTEFEPGKKMMIPLPIDPGDPADQARLAQARHRTFEFARSAGTDENPWTIKTDGGGGFTMDPRRISAAPQLATGPTEAGFSGDGTLEVWSIVNGGGGWSHPVHVHFEEGIILSRDGRPPPEWEKWARKDVYRIGPLEHSGSKVEVAIQFREFHGTYMEHCHNTQHEDNAMLLRWDLEHPGQFLLMPTPQPTWDGVEYVDSAALPTFRSGDGNGVF
jgi:FtsP/CotA-like multicopper oxidase with cupredoxin domain